MSDKVIPFPPRKRSPQKDTNILSKLGRDNAMAMGLLLMTFGVTAYMNFSFLEGEESFIKGERSLASVGHVNRNTVWEQQVAKVLASRQVGEIFTGNPAGNLDKLIALWGKNYRVLTNKEATQLKSVHLIPEQNLQAEREEPRDMTLEIEKVVKDFVNRKEYRFLLPEFDSFNLRALGRTLASGGKHRERKVLTLLKMGSPVAKVEFLYFKNKIIEINVRNEN